MSVTKRTVLKSVAAAGAVVAFSGVVPGVGALAAQPRLRVRRSVNTMALDDPDLETYRDFVGLMQDRPPTERVSWVGFANQHGNETSFKYCPHGDWYFLPWHRAYVEMYEKAAAALMKNPRFAMPYWDWTTLRHLPAAFTDKLYKGKPNPLYVPGRGDPATMQRNELVGPNALTDALVGARVMQQIYRETVFEAFGTSRNPQQDNLDPKWVTMGGGVQGILESTPHNNVHNNIGAYMPQANSPRDPIFMMHHGNIDRIWAGWNALGRKNSTDPLWLNMAFKDNFISPRGALYSRVVKNLQSTSALGYTYDNLPAPNGQPVDALRDRNLLALLGAGRSESLRRLKAANLAPFRQNAPLALSLETDAGAMNTVVSAPAGATQRREVVAKIADIRLGANVRAIRVFVNRETVSPDVPDTDPHFVTTLSFLRHDDGGEAHAGHHKSNLSALVNLTETLRSLSRTQGLPTDRLTLQLLPVPVPGTAAEAVGEVTAGSVEIGFL